MRFVANSTVKEEQTRPGDIRRRNKHEQIVRQLARHDRAKRHDNQMLGAVEDGCVAACDSIWTHYSRVWGGLCRCSWGVRKGAWGACGGVRVHGVCVGLCGGA